MNALLEIAQRAHEAALVVQVRNGTIAECQRWIRQTADILERVSPLAAEHYRSAADLLSVLRSP